MNDLLKQSDPTEPQLDPNKNYLEELVGPGKKFADAEALAKGKWYADQMIEIKNQREDELRAEYIRVSEENKAKANLAELIDQYKDRLTNSDHTPAKVDDTQQFDMTKIDSLLEEKLQRAEVTRRQEQNFSLVENKLKERYGNNYANVLKQETEALGLSKDFVNQMARTQPEAFLRLVGADRKPAEDTFQAPVRSNQRSDNFAPKGNEKRTWSYYQNLKRTQPNIYFDRKTAVQMAQDAVSLGEAFQDGDYFVKGLHEN